MLGSIADIRLGHLFRLGPDYVAQGGYPVIQLKDISPGEPINWEGLTRVREEQVKPEKYVRKGDVLLKSKGTSHLATTADDPLEDTVVSSQIIIIRVKNKSILPEYLTWYLNQEPAQKHMGKYAVGTNVMHLSTKHLTDMYIEIPDTKKQQMIVNVCKLQLHEKEIIEQIQSLRNKLIKKTMLNSISN